MGSLLYAVGVRAAKGRHFRPPTPTDLAAIELAEAEHERFLQGWEAEGCYPQ